MFLCYGEYMNIQDWLYSLITNRILISAAAGWFIAQASKVILEIIHKDFTIDKLVASGGMPSTHASTVCALAASCGITEGGGSGSFIVAIFFAFIVMYDSMGVRRASGKNTEVLNQYRQRDIQEGKTPVNDMDLKVRKGHTFPEIIAGGVIGILTAFVICCWIMPV